MGVYVNDNGTLREITRAFVNDAGVLREVPTWYVNDAGVLRTIFLRQVLLQNMSAQSIRVSPGNSFAGVRLNSDGNAEHSAINAASEAYTVIPFAWLVSGAAGDYECHMHLDSGDALNVSSGVDTWLALSSSQRWGYLITADGNSDLVGSFTLKIRRASDQVEIASCTVTLSAEVTV